MVWSSPIQLDSKYSASVPGEKGLYEIGYYRNDHFNPQYLGMSESSMQERFQAQARGEGNIGAADYLESAKRNNLYFRWQRHANPAKAEHDWLKEHGHGDGTKYPWNKRS